MVKKCFSLPIKAIFSFSRPLFLNSEAKLVNKVAASSSNYLAEDFQVFTIMSLHKFCICTDFEWRELIQKKKKNQNVPIFIYPIENNKDTKTRKNPSVMLIQLSTLADK